MDGTKLSDGAKGKAAIVLHMYKDYLWEMGSKSDPPEPSDEEEETDAVEEAASITAELSLERETPTEGKATPPPESESVASSETDGGPLTPEGKRRKIYFLHVQRSPPSSAALFCKRSVPRSPRCQM